MIPQIFLIEFISYVYLGSVHLMKRTGVSLLSIQVRSSRGQERKHLQKLLILMSKLMIK